MLKQRVQNNTSLNNASDVIFHGLNAALGLPLAILEALVNRLFPGLNLNLDEGMEAFLNSLKEVPLLGDIVKLITGVVDGGINELKHWFENLKKFLAHIDFNSPSFNPLAAAGDFIDMILAPVGKLATLIGGLLSGNVIPGLDASKIISGQFAQDMIAGLGGVLNGINTMVNQVIDVFRGVFVTPINQAIQDVKDWWNALMGRTSKLTSGGQMPPEGVKSPFNGANIVEDLSKIINGFWNGVTGESATNKTPDDVRTAAGQVKSAADDANAAAQFAVSMTVRPRRSPRWISTGTHDDVSFPIISAQSMFIPALNDITFIPITPDTDRIYKTLKFGLVGNTMTNCYVGVYKIGLDGTLTLATDLGDMRSSITASKVQTLAIPDLSVGRGETVFIAVRQVGGTAGQMFTTPSLLQVTEVVQPIPVYPTEKSNTGSGLPATISGAIARAESAPAWGALGETLLDSPWTDFFVPGWHTYDISPGARYIYIAASGAGGGGGGGDGGWGNAGGGGKRGQWGAVSLERGVGIPAEVTQLRAYVAASGLGSSGKEQPGASGGFSFVDYVNGADDPTLLRANGGAGGGGAYGGIINPSVKTGEAQVNYPFFGRLFIGGIEAPIDQNGNSPGGGGGGGSGGAGGSANAGRPGGNGFIAIRTA
ncbi:hypothetical protein [Mycobacteroides franklinii]|uniref:glycine-rich domain-containing protein n=1 Tax=Mycobacteroides franklinii TaxID=948102 RepID=UPI0013E8AB7A